MSKQVPNSYYLRDNQVQNQVQRQQYPTRQSGPRNVPPRASQAQPTMATSPGQAFRAPYAPYPQYGPQPTYAPMVLQHASPMPVNGGAMRMPQYAPYMHQAYTSSYGQGPQAQAPQYFMAGQTQQTAGMRPQSMTTMSMPGSGYVQQQTAAAPQPYYVPMVAPQAQQQPPKREKKSISIIDPQTGRDILDAQAGRDVLADNGIVRGSIETGGVRSQTEKDYITISSSLSSDADEYRPMSTVNGAAYIPSDSTCYAPNLTVDSQQMGYGTPFVYETNRDELPMTSYTQDTTFKMDDVYDSGVQIQGDLLAAPHVDVLVQPLDVTSVQPQGDTTVLAFGDLLLESVGDASVMAVDETVPLDASGDVPVNVVCEPPVEAVGYTQDTTIKMDDVNDSGVQVQVDSEATADSVSDEQLRQIPREELTVGPYIGRGGEGRVYEGKWNDQVVAVKILYDVNPESADVQDLLREGLFSYKLKHNNVIVFYGISAVRDQFGTSDVMALIMEFAEGGALNKALKQWSKKMDDNVRARWATQIANGMHYLRSQNCIHRDLKSSNVLIERKLNALSDLSHATLKIADFGHARDNISKTKTLSRSTGTTAWNAPEVIRDGIYSPASDVWSWAVVFWEIITGEVPHAGMEDCQIVYQIGACGLHPIIPQNCHPCFKEILTNCWNVDRNTRYQFSTLLEKLKTVTDDKPADPKQLSSSYRS